MKKSCIYIGLVFFLFGCNKKEVGPQLISDENVKSGNVLILNEGNFGFGNASVSVYNPNTDEIGNNQFLKINGFGIGDVLQSVNRYRDKFYFVVNNSGKIIITDTNLVYISEITGFNSPRYIEFYRNKAFVTDLKQKALYVLNLNNNQIERQIQFNGWTETILLKNNFLFVLDRGDYLSNQGPNFICKINPTTLEKEDSIQTFLNPNSMVFDKQGNLWVLTSGKSGVEKPKLTQYDFSSKKIVKILTFDSFSDSPFRLVMDKKKDKLYYINGSIFCQSVEGVVLNKIPFYRKTSESFYGLKINEEERKLYVTDAKDYSQLGELIIIEVNTGSETKRSLGVNPQFVFRY